MVRRRHLPRSGRVGAGAFLGLLLVLVLLPVPLLAGPAAAAGAAAYSVQVSATVVYPGCQKYDATYETTTPAATSRWVVAVRDGDGTVLGSSATTGAGGVVTFSLCAADSTDEYAVTGTLEQCDDAGVCTTTDVIHLFTLRRAHSRTTLRASPTRPVFNHTVTFTMRGTIESPQGYSGIAGVTIYLQIRSGGQWRRIDSSRQLTDRRGQARRSYRWNLHGPVRLRAVCAVSDTGIGHREKASRPITVRAR